MYTFNMKNPQVIKIVLLLACLSILVVIQGFRVKDPDVIGVSDNISQGEYYKVLDVVDGDTIKIEEVGTVRAIGIDTPETVDPRKDIECFGMEASNKAKDLLENQLVRIEFDESQGAVDKYGRVLAYIYLEDGRMFNEIMIKEGYAHEYTYDSEYKYQSDFKIAETFAKESQKGLWGVICQ